MQQPARNSFNSFRPKLIIEISQGKVRWGKVRLSGTMMVR